MKYVPNRSLSWNDNEALRLEVEAKRPIRRIKNWLTIVGLCMGIFFSHPLGWLIFLIAMWLLTGIWPNPDYSTY
jgi:hypothetical protein